MRKKLDYDYCSASPILEWLGDKWALVVLLKLHENEVIRFNELYKTIPSISEKMLSTVSGVCLPTSWVQMSALFLDYANR